MASLPDGGLQLGALSGQFSECACLAGCIDLCCQLSDGTFMLVDWKRTSGLPSKYSFSRRMKAPLQHLPDCTGRHYRLQLNIYRCILQRHYNMPVTQMLVVCCHPEHFPDAWIDEVPIMLEADAILDSLARDAFGGSLHLPSDVWAHIVAHYADGEYLANLRRPLLFSATPSTQSCTPILESGGLWECTLFLEILSLCDVAQVYSLGRCFS